jgi:PEGA domain
VSNPFATPPRRFLQLGAVALLGIGLLGAGVALVAKRSSSAASGGDGILTVTVSGEANGPVGELTVVADDVVRCTSSPCRIANLASGTHFVRVTADGYTATAARAVAVNSDGASSLHFQLSRIPTPIALDPREPEKPAAPKQTVDLDADSEAASTAAVEAPTTVRQTSSRQSTSSRYEAPSRHERESSKPAREEPASSRALKAAIAEQQPAAPAVEAPPPAPAGTGTLNINSTPSTNIVLDGRPLGKTPISGVKVSAGAHTIVFIGPDGKRKVGSTSIKPGATRSVGVKF